MKRKCNCRSIWCPIDEALHRLHIHIGWICDRHDRIITGGEV